MQNKVIISRPGVGNILTGMAGHELRLKTWASYLASRDTLTEPLRRQSFKWTEKERMDDLSMRVDEAMLLAKSEGRNRAEISYYVKLS